MLDIKQLLEAGVHFGHNSSRWHPKMSPFIWGTRSKIHLIDVSKTAFLLKRAGDFLEAVMMTGKPVLWVGTKKAAQSHVAKLAQRTGMPSVIHRWIGGTLSNHEQVKKAITRLLHLRDIMKKSIESYGKKEQSMLQKELARLEKNVGGIVDLAYPPGAIIIVDAKKERSSVKEANMLNIPVIAMVDTNTDPSNIPFIIPSNDDSPNSIACVLEYLATRIELGKKKLEAQKAADIKERAEEKVKKAVEKTERKPDEQAPVEMKAEEKAEEKQAAPRTERPLHRDQRKIHGGKAHTTDTTDKKKTIRHHKTDDKTTPSTT